MFECVSTFDGSKAAEARGLLLQVKSFQFILCIDRLLSCVKGLSDVLQGIQIDLAKAADLVLGTVETIEAFHSDDEWEKVFRYCENVAKLHNIPKATSRSRRLPKRFDDGIILETTGIRDESDNYKINLYYPVLDSFLCELKRRFSDKNKDIMRALQACCPTSQLF